MWWKYNRGIGMIISWADVIFGEEGMIQGKDIVSSNFICNVLFLKMDGVFLDIH